MRAASGTAALRDELRDLYALETRLHSRITAELSTGALGERAEAWALLKRLEPRCYAHQAELAEALHRMHGRVPWLQRTLVAMLERVMRWLEPARSMPEATGDLCDIYALLSATTAAYLVLATSASTLGDPQTAALAERSVDDANAFLDEIAVLLPELARAEVIGRTGTPLAAVEGESSRSEGRMR
jgi:hypothetical protein